MAAWVPWSDSIYCNARIDRTSPGAPRLLGSPGVTPLTVLRLLIVPPPGLPGPFVSPVATVLTVLSVLAVPHPGVLGNPGVTVFTVIRVLGTCTSPRGLRFLGSWTDSIDCIACMNCTGALGSPGVSVLTVLRVSVRPDRRVGGVENTTGLKYNRLCNPGGDHEVGRWYKQCWHRSMTSCKACRMWMQGNRNCMPEELQCHQ